MSAENPSAPYILLVHTNSYAGNFEREMCGFMTGIVGECEVGDGEAEKFREETREQIQNQIDTGFLTIGEWAEAYLDYAKRRFVKKTYKGKKRVFKYFFKMIDKDISISSLNVQAIREYYLHLGE
jgi:hypothetical protein